MDNQPDITKPHQPNKKNIIIALGAIGLLIVGIASVMIIKSWFVKPQIKNPESTIADDTLPPADPSIEVSASLTDDGHEILLGIKHIPSDIKTIEYEISYMTGEGLSKGALSDPAHAIKLEPNQSEYSKKITLGTCSRGKCVYDQGVKNVSVVLKFNGPKGSSIFQKDFSL